MILTEIAEMGKATVVMHATALLVCLGTALLWIYSYTDPGKADIVFLHDQNAHRSYFVHRGEFFVLCENLDRICPSEGRFHWGYGSSTTRPDDAAIALAIPFWPIVLVSFAWGIYPFLPRYRRWHRQRKGLCATCGYNLKGLTEARCPECGEPFAVRMADRS